MGALRESGDHLLSLVNDVLDFARLAPTAIELHAAPVDVENLLRQVAELLSPRAHEKAIEIALGRRASACRPSWPMRAACGRCC